MYLFEGLQKSVSSFLPSEQVELIVQAYKIAKHAHEGQFRTSGEPYITHPIAVALILSEMHLDHETIMGALLHDTIEDTEVTYDFLVDKFGLSVANLVEGVSKLDKIKFRDKKEAEAENFRKMVLAMTEDIRVILIKLADRTHNMKTLGSFRDDKKQRIARETLEIYAPIANRLGIHSMKRELEDLGLQIQHPIRYKVIKNSIEAGRGYRKEVLAAIETAISNRLLEHNISAQIVGRTKNIYSIYNKIKKKKIKFQDVLDLYAFRVIVKDIDTCYRTLGIIHSIYKPRPQRFKDYIAIPKANGYQSLHSSLVGPHGLPVEIQIRTEDMNLMADKGIAAHWLYKNEDKNGNTAPQIRASKWIQNLLELQQNANSTYEFVENVKTELFPEEIYVFTPNGKILVLPLGSTAVDFAYEVHTDIGDKCVGAKVNRQAYPISSPLSSGQTVEIITAKNAKPNAAWLNFVVTSKARANIRHFLKNLHFADAVNLGKRLVNHALGESTIDNIDKSVIDKVLKDAKYKTLDAMFADIGVGNSMSFVIAQRLLGNITATNKDAKMPIRGSDGMLVTFANCCRPIPGDSIIAHISQGKGLVVHMDSCANIKGHTEDTSKYIHVQWDDNDDAEHQANLTVDIQNHQGILAKIIAIIADEGSNIQSLTTNEKNDMVHQVQMRLTVKNRVHLARVMRKIRVLPEILHIARNH